jgi:uncharacterized membrane protein YeaQ/YmgE (transglycosylase-associated protein family)
VAIISWIVLGTLTGLAVNGLLRGRFPGGMLGTILGGTAGAFLGGAIFSLAADRGVTGLDPISLCIAFAGAALLLAVIRKAGYADLSRR